MADFDTIPTDDETFAVEPQTDNSNFAALEKELKRVIRNDLITLSVPSRPGMSLVFDPNIEANRLQAWRKACRDKSMPDNFDSAKFSYVILANQCKNVIWQGETITDEDGKDLNFRNPNFLRMLGAMQATAAVKMLYANDGHVFIATDEVLRAAGYDSEGQEQQADPTLLV